MRGKKVASTAITTTSTITVINSNLQAQVQSVKSRPFITLAKYIPLENQCGSKQEKKQKQKSWKTSTYENQDVFLYDGLLAEPTQ